MKSGLRDVDNMLHTVEIHILREIVLYENNTIFSYDFHDIILIESEFFDFPHC